jgi:hypothetical protein
MAPELARAQASQALAGQWLRPAVAAIRASPLRLTRSPGPLLTYGY